MQKMGGPICTSYDVFLCRELPFWVAMIAPALKFLPINFLIAINSLTCSLVR